MLPQTHRIRPGETLSSIAEEHGLASWRALYFADCNRAFRRANPDPDKISAGRTIKIPRDAREQRRALQARLARLQQGRREALALFQEQRRDIQESLGEIEQFSTGVDTTATVLTTIASLGTTTVKANKIMKLEGDELAKETSKFMKDALKGRASNARDLAAKAVSAAESESSGTVSLLAKSVAQAWCDMTSPSFWANTLVTLYDQYREGGVDEMSWSQAVTTRPEDIAKQLLARLKATETKALADLDGKIRETQAALKGL